MKTRMNLMEEEIENKQTILHLEKRIISLEKGLIKSKMPLEIFGEEKWFKIDVVGNEAFSKLCGLVRESNETINNLKYDLNIQEKIIDIIKSKNLTKKLKIEVQKELDDLEIEPSFFEVKKK